MTQHHINPGLIIFVFTCLLLVGSLSGCSSSDTAVEPAAKVNELTDKEKVKSDQSEEELFENATHYYLTGLYSVARESFEALRDGYPLGAYGEFAELKAADAYFESSAFDTAAPLYENFIKNRPASEATPYALLRAARSYQLSNKGIGRDSAPLKKALGFYDSLLSQYPTSPYIDGAQVWREEVRASLAEGDKRIISFYRKQLKVPALQVREQEFQKQWGVPPDVFSLPEESPALIEKVSAPPVGDAAVRTLPVSDKKNNVETTTQAQTLTPGITLIRQVECDRAGKIAMLYLTKTPTDKRIVSNSGELTPTSGAISFQVFGARTASEAGYKKDCFGEKDLSVSAEGLITLQTVAKSVLVETLDNPPRILVALSSL